MSPQKLPKLTEKIENYSIFGCTLTMETDNRYQKTVSDNTKKR